MYLYIMFFVTYVAVQAVEPFELNTSTIGPTMPQCSTCVTQISDGQLQEPLSSSSYQSAVGFTTLTTVPMSESSQPVSLTISHSNRIGFSISESLCLAATETITVVITLSSTSSFSTTTNTSNELSLLRSGDSHSTLPPSSIQPSSTLATLLSPEPIPVSTATAPQATCKAATKGITTTVIIWTNYITDGGLSLMKQLMLSCPHNLAQWAVSTSQTEFPFSDGSWKANQEFTFILPINHPSELHCVMTAVIKAGGPPSMLDCSYTTQL